MKTALTLALLALLSGCAAVAPSQSYRPANYAGAPLSISGSYNDFSGEVLVEINGKPSAQGSISVLSGDGEFFGNFEGRKVAVSCFKSVGLFKRRTTCQVFVDGDRAAALSF